MFPKKRKIFFITKPRNPNKIKAISRETKPHAHPNTKLLFHFPKVGWLRPVNIPFARRVPLLAFIFLKAQAFPLKTKFNFRLKSNHSTESIRFYCVFSQTDALALGQPIPKKNKTNPKNQATQKKP